MKTGGYTTEDTNIASLRESIVHFRSSTNPDGKSSLRKPDRKCNSKRVHFRRRSTPHTFCRNSYSRSRNASKNATCGNLILTLGFAECGDIESSPDMRALRITALGRGPDVRGFAIWTVTPPGNLHPSGGTFRPRRSKGHNARERVNQLRAVKSGIVIDNLHLELDISLHRE